MHKIILNFPLFIIIFISFSSCSQSDLKTFKTKHSSMKKLTKDEERVIILKGTEAPFIGEYTDVFDEGTYHCKQCNSHLYFSNAKFHSSCGWPSFDQEITGSVTKVLDADGRRTEIICSNCKGHLGHVFDDGPTETGLRYCVNSISIGFEGTEKEDSKK